MNSVYRFIAKSINKLDERVEEFKIEHKIK